MTKRLKVKRSKPVIAETQPVEQNKFSLSNRTAAITKGRSRQELIMYAVGILVILSMSLGLIVSALG